MSGNKTLKKLLFENEVSQRELAQIAGVTESCICKLVQGVKNPSVETLQKIADFFDVLVDDIMIRTVQE